MGFGTTGGTEEGNDGRQTKSPKVVLVEQVNEPMG